MRLSSQIRCEVEVVGEVTFVAPKVKVRGQGASLLVERSYCGYLGCTGVTGEEDQLS